MTDPNCGCGRPVPGITKNVQQESAEARSTKQLSAVRRKFCNFEALNSGVDVTLMTYIVLLNVSASPSVDGYVYACDSRPGKRIMKESERSISGAYTTYERRPQITPKLAAAAAAAAAATVVENLATPAE